MTALDDLTDALVEQDELDEAGDLEARLDAALRVEDLQRAAAREMADDPSYHGGRL